MSASNAPCDARPIILLASSRSDGNTFALARRVFSEHDAPLVDLHALNIGYFAYDEANAGDDFIPLIERLVEAPVWVLATPLYWYTMSAQAKTFIDRLTDLLTTHAELGRRLRGKALAVLCAGTDPQPPAGFATPFALTCTYLGMSFLGVHYGRFDGRALVDDRDERGRAFRQRLLAAAGRP